jgi:hypothetical protein
VDFFQLVRESDDVHLVVEIINDWEIKHLLVDFFGWMSRLVDVVVLFMTIS